MKSMTGYGRAELILHDHSGVIELSSVNKKGFEFLLHGPKEWQFFEKKAQEITRTRAERGRIRLSILINAHGTAVDESTDQQQKRVNEQLELLRNLCAANSVEYSPNSELIQRILTSSLRDPMLPVLENIEDQLVNAVEVALDDMIAMRENEGKTLSNDLNARLITLRKLVEQINSQTIGQASEWRDRLLQRLAESGLEIDCENESVRREFAVYAEKSDISEETTRILSHLEQFEKGLNQQSPVGRRLEFIVQELGREFNTLGSKSSRSEVSNLVIDAKVEIEKIREQVMNIE